MGPSSVVNPPFLVGVPTRVRRNYAGGGCLPTWVGGTPEPDGPEPEDWIASTLEARNPGLPPRPGEGVTQVRRPDGSPSDLRREIALAPAHLLGPDHLARRGHEIGFLAKLLDAAIRLHIQAHPTAAFAQTYLNSRYGKLETYIILGARADAAPYVLLGFKEAPTRAEWRRIIAEQDRAAMEACLHRLPLRPGDVWLVPGGMPHAIGPGVIMLEVMEPSDWVVRCEFEREGIVVPPEARFMGRDLEFCLEIFDYRTMTEEEVDRRCRLAPHAVVDEPGVRHEELVGAGHTDCFSVHRLRANRPVPAPGSGRFRLMLVTAGSGIYRADGETCALGAGTRLLLPAGASEGTIEPAAGGTLEAVFVWPN